MQICFEYATSLYSMIFLLFKCFSLIILLYFYIRKIQDLYKFPDYSLAKIDLILIYLSLLQLILFLLILIYNCYLFSILITINKFSQNLMIDLLLIRYILIKYEKSIKKIIEYFPIIILIIDIIIFLLYISEAHIFEINTKDTILNLIISIFCFLSNGIIGIMTYLNKKRAQNMILEHLNNSKTLSNIKINNDDINNNIKEDLITDNKEEKENENGFINTIYNKNLNNLITIIYVYFYILIPFLISYFIDLFFYLSNEGNINEERNDNITNNNNTNYMNNTNNEFNKTEIYNNTCIFSSNSDSNKFNFINLIIYFGFFCLRDIFPYLMIYLMFFYYKKKNYHRPSF